MKAGKSVVVNGWLSFAEQTEHEGIQFNLIGLWSDLAAYYGGSDGNAWAYHVSGRSWVNNGPVDEFCKRLKAGKIRGKLLGQ